MKNKSPKKPYSLPAVITADILLLAVSLSSFCYFHHIRSLWGIGADKQVKNAEILSADAADSAKNEANGESSASDGDFRSSFPEVFLPSDSSVITLSEHEKISDYLTENSLPSSGELDSTSREFLGLYRSHDIFMTSEKIDTVIHYNNKTYDVAYYLYDVYIADIENLFTAYVPDREPIEDLASASYELTTSGSYITSPAIFAINGDYVGNDNHVLFAVRNGELVRDSDYIGADICVIYENGVMETVTRNEFDRDALLEKNPWQVWEFGPSLLDSEGNALYDFNESFYDDNVISNRHPRSSIGYYEPGHYCFIVVDGRSEDSKGVRLFQLGEIYQQLGVGTAYNFDGGDSAQSLWNGQKHRTDEERRLDGDDQRKLYDIAAIGEVSEK